MDEITSGTIKELYERKSVRAFEQRGVSDEVKRAVLRAAAEAPTAGNQQLYTIIDVTDGEIKARLAELCDNQPFIAKAPVVLVFCADAQRWYDAYELANCAPRKPRAGDLMLAVCDALIAAQNAVVAAQSLSLGSCYIGDVMENCEQMREQLCLPRYVFPAAMLVMGYPTRQQLERQKPQRLELDDFVCENRYRAPEPQRLREALSAKEGGAPFEEWMTAFCKRKYNSDFSLEMSRSVEKYLEAFARDD